MYSIKHVDFYYQIFPNNLDRFFNILLKDQPNYILGLGIYTGRDQDKIRIETTCTNRVNNNYADSDSQLRSLAINYFVKPQQHSKLAYAMGTSSCNIIS
jgi:hypothetical protein